MVAFPSESPDILSETCVTGVARAALRRPLRRRATPVRPGEIAAGGDPLRAARNNDITPSTDTGPATRSVATTHLIAASTMAMSCSVVPPLTPTPAITWPSLVKGTPPPIAEYLPPATARRG